MWPLGGTDSVAFRIHVGVAGLVLGVVEVLGHEHFGAVVHRERLPAGGLRAEHRAPPGHSDHVDPQRFAQLVVDFAEHLVGLGHFDAVARVAQHGLPQAGERRHVNARDGRRAEIHAHAIRLLVGQRRPAVARGTSYFLCSA